MFYIHQLAALPSLLLHIKLIGQGLFLLTLFVLKGADCKRSLTWS